MHAYYDKNRNKIRREMERYLRQVRPEVEAIFGKSYELAFEEIWDYYLLHMMEYFPYIGGDRVSGTKNLTGCMFFIAIGAAGKRYGLSVEEWGRLSTELYRRYFEKIPGIVKSLARWLFFRHPEVIRKLLEKKDRQNRRNAVENPGSFVTRVMDPTEEYPVIFHNLNCPIYEFCRERGYMEYLPYMCNLDYVMFGAMGIPLYREKTCSAGDGCCDFKIKRSGPVPSLWPPHILDEEDPLK